MNTLLRIVIWGSLLASATAYGNAVMPMHFSHLSVEDGLSQNNVQAMLQDSAGYMWFATESGLNRYDGYDFTVYRHDPQDPTDDHERLDAEQGRETEREQLLEDPVRPQCDPQPGPDEDEERHQDRGCAGHAELLADGGEDEVGLGGGDAGRIPQSRTGAEQAALGQAERGLDELEP